MFALLGFSMPVYWLGLILMILFVVLILQWLRLSGPLLPPRGNMLQKGRNYIFSAPHIVMSPGLATMLVDFGFSLVGDGLRDALDPRFRR